jgi:hypothetical protein
MADQPPARTGGRAHVFNLITAILLALTLTVCCVTAYLLVSADRQPLAIGGQAAPTLVGFPTRTPTLPWPSPNPTGTATPLPTTTGTPTITPTPTITNTPLPSLTPTVTETPENSPTPTATETAQATDTPSPTDTEAPTATETEAPFDYVLVGEPTYNAQTTCDWLGIAGTVIDENGDSMTGVRVRVTGGGIDETTTSGSKTDYGPSGWEVFIDTALRSDVFEVRIVSASNEPLSDTVTVETIPDCQSNLVLLRFEKIQ